MAPAMSAWRAHATQLISITTYSSSYKLMICYQYVMLCQLTGYNMFQNVMICCVVRYFNIFQLNIQYLEETWQRANQNLTQPVAWVISKDAFSSQDRLEYMACIMKSMRNLWEIYEKSIWHYENFMRNLWEIYMTLWEYVRVEWNGRFIRQHNNLSCELSWIICYIRYIHQCNMYWARLCIQDSYGFILQSDLGL